MVASFVASDKKRRAIFRCLLKYGADPTLRDVYGRNSLMYACALAHRDETRFMIKDCDYDLNATDMYGDTLLHFCAKVGCPQVLGVVLREMIRYKMNISIQNHTHFTPLSLAILNGNHECANILHQAGGSPRFSPPKLLRVMRLLASRQKEISSAGLKAIHDSKEVSRVLYGKSHCVLEADEKITREDSCSETKEREIHCILSESEELTLRLPPLPACNLHRVNTCKKLKVAITKADALTTGGSEIMLKTEGHKSMPPVLCRAKTLNM
jgi:ankyrin repeat protein